MAVQHIVAIGHSTTELTVIHYLDILHLADKIYEIPFYERISFPFIEDDSFCERVSYKITVMGSAAINFVMGMREK